VDACICVAASGALGDFEQLTEIALHENMRGKFFGQINLVLIGLKHLSQGGSFTLSTGIFADYAWPGITGGAVISGGLHSFVRSALIELKRGLRINAVSPSMVADSVEAYGHPFPGLEPVPMDQLAAAYVGCVESRGTGEIVRVFGEAVVTGPQDPAKSGHSQAHSDGLCSTSDGQPSRGNVNRDHQHATTALRRNSPAFALPGDGEKRSATRRHNRGQVAREDAHRLIRERQFSADSVDKVAR
jgi:hypothetical protein